MDRFDGRAMAVGIVLGMVVGLVIFYFTDNQTWIYLSAAIGAILLMNSGIFPPRNSGGDKDNPPPKS